MMFLRTDDAHRMRQELEHVLAWKLRYELNASRAGRLYIVLASESPIQFSGDWLGATAPAMGNWLRSAIGGRWHGPGPTLMLNDHLLGWDDFGAAAVHEVAHILTARSLFVSEGGSGSRSRLPKRSTRMLTLVSRSLANPSAANEGHHHDFIRAMLHLRQWLIDCGWRVPINSLLHWQWFTGREGDEFLAALGDEPQRLREMSISQILKTHPAATFSAVWAAAKVATVSL